MKTGEDPKSVKDDHPARQWSGSWGLMSLSDNDLNSPLILDGERLLLPKPLKIHYVVKLHQDTHISVKKMMDTLKKSCTWIGMKEDIEKVWGQCEGCKRLQQCLPEGHLQLDKIPLTSLQPMSVLHCDLFSFE